jgi:hypothetical protein
MNIDVRFDAKRAIATLEGYRRGIGERAIARALNRTGTTVRAEAARLIAPQVRPIKINEIRRAITIRRATPANLVTVVRAGGRRRIPITALGATQNRRGVRVRIGGRSVLIPHAFIQPVRGGRDAARIRAPDFKGQLFDQVRFRGKRVQRSGPDFPVAEIFAPGIPAAFVDREVLVALGRVARARFVVALAQELRFARTRSLGA